MKKSDVQLGKPSILYKGTTAELSALSAVEGMQAYDTTLDKFVYYDGSNWAEASGGGSITVEEQDGTPSVSNVNKIKVTNGTLTDDGSGVVSIDLGGGSLARMAVFVHEGELIVGSGVTRIYNLTGANLTISKVHAALTTAPAGSSAIFDVNQNGNTIFTTQANRPIVLSGANIGETSTINTPVWTNGNYLTVDIDQIGSSTAGSDLTLTIVCS